MGLIRDEVGDVFQHLRKSFIDISWKEREKSRMRKAIVFEANRRLIEHPSDLCGLRHARYFAESLYDYLRKEEKIAIHIFQACMSRKYGQFSDLSVQQKDHGHLYKLHC
eukprot:TRINITY_DN32605_c0_g1_i1.p1 TRINITY_DN32605_c0_g1~~TRINITY_DN32605_c0_g1_i1.p1  ORF type:complete len:119 (+),score=17.89 TRINITY_DN32605_c0_g1_i1:31-357(+)